jgi:hypothetical protein
MSKLSDIAKRYYELQEKSEATAKVLKEINTEWTGVEAEMLEMLVEEGVNTIKLAEYGTFMMKTTNILSVNIADKPRMFEYLKESGNGGLIKEDVASATLTAFLGKHYTELSNKYIQNGLDEIEAGKVALEFLNKKGANYFTKRGISLKRS